MRGDNMSRNKIDDIDVNLFRQQVQGWSNSELRDAKRNILEEISSHMKLDDWRIDVIDKEIERRDNIKKAFQRRLL